MWYSIVKRYTLFGKLAFWIAWPVSFVRLIFSRRSRVAVIYNNKVLVVRDWLNAEWHLPGGGLKFGETDKDGARRELLEEVGILADDRELVLLQKGWSTPTRGLYYRYASFLLLPDQLPGVDITEHEITDYKWINLANLRQTRNLSRNTVKIIKQAQESLKLS